MRLQPQQAKQIGQESPAISASGLNSGGRGSLKYCTPEMLSVGLNLGVGLESCRWTILTPVDLFL